MERTTTKIFLLLFIASSLVWLFASANKNYYAGKLLQFGTVEFKSSLDPADERMAYRSIAEYSILAFLSYPFLILGAAGFLKTTRRSLKKEGWLMMSALLVFLFVPVELYCFWLDWKIVGLQYWGEWPLTEFRSALYHRITALAGLPLIAQLCYYTIPIFIIFKPMKLNRQHE